MTDIQGRRRAALTLASAFIVGGLVGVGGSRWIRSTRSPRGWLAPAVYRNWLLEDLSARLDLDSAQREQVEIILDQYEERFLAVREAMEPELEAIRADRADQIMEVLTSEQQAAYEALLAERRSGRRERHWRNPPRRR